MKYHEFNRRNIDIEEFHTILKQQIKFKAFLSSELTDILYNHLSYENINSICELFNQSFKNVTSNAKNPVHREMFNKLLESNAALFTRLRLEGETRLKSFDYQLKGYLENLISDYLKSYQNGDHYVPINGEIRTKINIFNQKHFSQVKRKILVK